MYNINQIDCTLKYGKVHNKQLKLLNIISLILIVISNLLFVGGIVLLVLSEISKKEFGLIAVIYVFISLFVVTCRFLYNKNKKRNNEIQNWLNDAVECKAKIKRIDYTNILSQPYQIEVNFNYKGKELKKISNRTSLLTEGYPKVFAKYHNKKVNILYSEKFDEVLLINNIIKE